MHEIKDYNWVDEKFTLYLQFAIHNSEKKYVLHGSLGPEGMMYGIESKYKVYSNKPFRSKIYARRLWQEIIV